MPDGVLFVILLWHPIGKLFVLTLVIKGSLAFFWQMTYTEVEQIGGVTVNEFEQDVQCKRNDATDSAAGFIVSFGFFATMFIIAVVIQLIGS